MILLIDNYDSFSYNLYQLIGEMEQDIRVIRNDEMTVEEITAFGATVTYAKELMHGKQSQITFDKDCLLFQACPENMQVARYHSLAAEMKTMPECLKVTAKTEDGEVMAVQHKDYPIYGVQFHPESIMTPDGKTMLKNFLQGGMSR